MDSLDVLAMAGFGGGADCFVAEFAVPVRVISHFTSPDA